MIITQSPYRVSFFGGGTDYAQWYMEHGGCFLSMTINRYITVGLRPQLPFFNREFTVYWRIAERVGELADIQNPIVRELAKYLKVEKGFQFSYFGDLPSQSGMGSSSSFAVAAILAFYKLCNLEISPLEAAQLAYNIEFDKLGETVGVQDHIAAAFGGFNFVTITKDGKFRIRRIIMERQQLLNFTNRCLLVYTGIERHATKMAEKQVQNIKEKTQNYQAIQQMAYNAYDLIEERNFDDFGRLLHETWLMKRAIAPGVSNDTIDNIYELGRQNGALGGKLLGAGGGGFVLLFHNSGDTTGLKRAFKDYYTMPIQVSQGGARIILPTDGHDEQG